MQTHAIVELEEGSLSLVLGGRSGRKVLVRRCLRMPLADLGRDALATILRSLGSDQLQGVAGVHVILGERRLQHFLSTVPRMKGHEVEDFVRREALRVTGMPAADAVLIAPRFVRTLPGGKLLVGACAGPRSVWEPLRDAFTAAGVAVLGLHSMESCLALGAPAALGDRVAVLEGSAGRARFVLCEAQSVVQVRRFVLGSAGDGSPGAVAAQLSMELPRTLDWLRETGHSEPAALVVGHRIELDDAAFESVRRDLPMIVRAERDVQVADGEAVPGLASTALLRRLCTGASVPSMLAPFGLDLPWGRARVAAVAAAVLTAGLCTWSAAADAMALVSAKRDLEQVHAANESAMQQLLEHGAATAAADAGQGAGDEALARALGMRRPVSRLLAEVGTCAAGAVQLESLQFASADRVVVSGFVQGSSRKAALAALVGFAQRIRDLPYLQSTGQEDIGELAGPSRGFRFKIGLAWRNS